MPHFWLADPILNGRTPLENSYYPYGWDGNGRFLLHNGADMPQPAGTLVTAVADGTIRLAQGDQEETYGWRCDWYGLFIVLELTETWQGMPIYILYGHIRNLLVEPGQVVQQGQLIAEVGAEGVAAVPHLHLEVRVGDNQFNQTRNPMLWLPPIPGTGLLAGRLVDANGRPWQGVRLTLINGRGSQPLYEYTFTYLDDPQQIIHADEALAENFVFADLAPGEYTLFASINGVEQRQMVTIAAGEITAVELIHPAPP